MDVIEKNKSLAEFAGFTQVYPNLNNYDKPTSPAHLLQYKPNEENSIFNKNLHKSSNPFCVKNDYHPRNMHFNSSWDWLMPVIEKISKLPTDDGMDTYYPRTFGMLEQFGEFMFRFNRHSLFTAPTLIEAAFEACVEFIQYHNNQK